MASKRKQDEKHLNTLRGMAKLDHNKHCFDCHQRGPTYLNMTIGAFVCTGCSGLLRGLNPPHRVKSISMASFTPDEIEFVKNRGNELCRKVWLGLYDNKKIDFVDKDENKIKDFMTQKYEKNRYYVAPTDAMMEQAKKDNTPPKTEPQAKPLRSLGNIPSLNTPPQTVPGTQRPTPIQSSQSAQTHTFNTLAIQNHAAAHSPQTQQQTQPQPKKQPAAGGGFDLLGELGGDPFASSKTGSTPAAGGGGFADFGAFPGATSASPATQMSHSLSQPTGFTPNTGVGVLSPQPPGHPGNNGVVVQSNSFGAFSTASSTTSSGATVAAGAAGGMMSQSDKYSALAALDTALSSSPTPTQQAVNWDGSMFGGGGSSSGMSASTNNNSAFGGGTGTVSSAGFNSAPNPFGVGSSSGVNANQGMVANPFSSAGTGFGQSGASFSQPATGFNQMSTTQQSAAGGSSGHFRGVANGNMNPPQPQQQQPQHQQMWGMSVQGHQQPMATHGQGANAFGGSGMNAFGAGGMVAGGNPAVNKTPGFPGGGHPQQPQQQQQFGGWGAAQPAANPFMNVASQQPSRPLNSTNPFL